jgi:FkbM family methyltransferase
VGNKCALLVKMFKRYGTWSAILRVVEYFGLLGPRSCMVSLRNGLHLRCRGETNDFQIVDEIFVKGIYDQAIVSLRGGAVVIDVGANIGLFTLAAAQRGARVYCFEPMVENLSLLRENISLNGYGDRVFASELAVSCNEGEMEFFVKEGDTGGATGYVEVHQDWFERGRVKRQVHKRMVTCITLSDALSRCDGRCDLLKMDCEGAEYDIFEYVDGVTLGQIGSIMLEYHPYHRDVRSITDKLERSGFVVTVRPEISLVYATRGI